MAGRTTLGRMLQWLEGPLQTSVSRERDHMIKQANKIRRMFYDLYSEFEIEVDIEECFAIQDLGHCSGCQKDTKGITLPPYMQTVESAWASGDPLNLYSKWREYKTGLKLSSDCLRAIYDIPGRFPTERELCPASILHSVQLMCRNKADEGKPVIVTYDSEDGRKEEAAVLAYGGYRKLAHKASKILSVVLPTNLVGQVVIAQSDAPDNLRILSEYQPWEHVPSYRRIQITGVGDDEVVVIRSSRQYTDVFDDNDIIETDNIIAIENAARFLFYSESGTGQELKLKSDDHYQMMRRALQGMNSRDRGQKSDDTFMAGPPIKRSKLRRRRRGHNLR